MLGGRSGKGPGMDVDRLRAETPGTEHRIHLNNAGAALMSRRTLAAAGINATVTVPEDDPLDTEERGLPALLRLSPHYYNTETELDRAVEVIAGL